MKEDYTVDLSPIGIHAMNGIDEDTVGYVYAQLEIAVSINKLTDVVRGLADMFNEYTDAIENLRDAVETMQEDKG